MPHDRRRPAAADGAAPVPWPAEAIAQIAALRRLVAAEPLDVDGAARRFTGARRELVARHLETLAILGEVRTADHGRYAAAPAL